MSCLYNINELIHYCMHFSALIHFHMTAVYDLRNAFFPDTAANSFFFRFFFQISRKAHTSGTMRQSLMTPRPWDNIATGYGATSPTPSNLWSCTWRHSTGESHKQTCLFASLYLGVSGRLSSLRCSFTIRFAQRRKIDTESDPGHRIEACSEISER